MLPKESITYRGVWWLPKNGDMRLAGTLSIERSKGICLEITGSFSEEPGHFLNRDAFHAIHGVTNENKVVTLFYAQSGGSSWSANGVTITKHRVQMVIFGAHYATVEDVKLLELNAEYDHLADWLGISGFKMEHAFTERRIFSMDYTRPDDIVLYQTQEWEWKIRWSVQLPTTRIPQKDVQLSETPYLHVVSPKPVTFDELHTHAQQFRKLLALWIGSPVQITSINGTAVIDGARQPVEFLWPSRFDERAPVEISNFELVAKWSELRSELPRLVAFYRDNEAQVAPVLGLWDLLPFQEDIHYEQRFLNYCQIAEAFHRRTIGGVERSEEEFNQRKKTILDAVPDKEVRKWLEWKLSFANEYSLQDRIRDLWQRNGEVTSTFPYDKDAFTSRVGFIRNYLTHFKLKKGEVAPEFREVITLEFYLRVLIEAGILRWLNLPDAIVAKQAKFRLARAPVIVSFKETKQIKPVEKPEALLP